MVKEASLKKFNDFLKRMDPRRGRQESPPRGNDRFPRSSSVPPNGDRSFPTYGIPITITTTDIPTDTVFSPSRVQAGGTMGLPINPNLYVHSNASTPQDSSSEFTEYTSAPLGVSDPLGVGTLSLGGDSNIELAPAPVLDSSEDQEVLRGPRKSPKPPKTAKSSAQNRPTGATVQSRVDTGLKRLGTTKASTAQAKAAAKAAAPAKKAAQGDKAKKATPTTVTGKATKAPPATPTGTVTTSAMSFGTAPQTSTLTGATATVTLPISTPVTTTPSTTVVTVGSGAKMPGIAPDTYSTTLQRMVTATGANLQTTPATATRVAVTVQPTYEVTPPPQPQRRARAQTREDLDALRAAARSITTPDEVDGAEVWKQIKSKLLLLNFDRPNSFMDIWRLYTEEAAKFTLQGTFRPHDSFTLFLDNTKFYQDAIDLYVLNSEARPETHDLTEEIRRLSVQIMRSYTPYPSPTGRGSQTGNPHFDRSVDEVLAGLEVDQRKAVQMEREQTELEKKYHDAMSQVSKLNAEINQLKSDMAQDQTRYTRLERERNNLGAEIQRLHAEQETLTRKHQSEVRNLRAQADALEHRISQGDTSGLLAEYQSRLDNAEAETRRLKNAEENWGRDRRNLEAQIQELRDGAAQATLRATRTEEKLEEVRGNLASWKKENDQLRVLNDQLRVKLHNEETRKDELAIKVDRLKERIDQDQRNYEILNSNYEKELTANTAALQRETALLRQVDQLQHDKDHAVAEKNTLQTKVSELTSEMDRLKVSLNDLRKQMNDAKNSGNGERARFESTPRGESPIGPPQQMDGNITIPSSAANLENRYPTAPPPAQELPQNNPPEPLGLPKGGTNPPGWNPDQRERQRRVNFPPRENPPNTRGNSTPFTGQENAGFDPGRIYNDPPPSQGAGNYAYPSGRQIPQTDEIVISDEEDEYWEDEPPQTYMQYYEIHQDPIGYGNPLFKAARKSSYQRGQTSLLERAQRRQERLSRQSGPNPPAPQRQPRLGNPPVLTGGNSQPLGRPLSRGEMGIFQNLPPPWNIVPTKEAIKAMDLEKVFRNHEFKGEYSEYRVFRNWFIERIHTTLNTISEKASVLAACIKTQPAVQVLARTQRGDPLSYHQMIYQLEKEFGDPEKHKSNFLDDVISWTTVKYTDVTRLLQVSQLIRAYLADRLSDGCGVTESEVKSESRALLAKFDNTLTLKWESWKVYQGRKPDLWAIADFLDFARSGQEGGVPKTSRKTGTVTYGATATVIPDDDEREFLREQQQMLLDLQNRQAELESALNNLSSTSGSYCLSDEDDNSQQRIMSGNGNKNSNPDKQPESNPQGSKNGERRSEPKGSDERRRTNDRRSDTRQGRSDRRENSRGREEPRWKNQRDNSRDSNRDNRYHHNVAEVLPPVGNHTVSFALNPLSHIGQNIVTNLLISRMTKKWKSWISMTYALSA